MDGLDLTTLCGAGCGANNGGCQHECRLSQQDFLCSCRAGFTLNQDQRTCREVDECRTNNNGGCEDICTSTQRGTACSCSPGKVQYRNTFLYL